MNQARQRDSTNHIHRTSQPVAPEAFLITQDVLPAQARVLPLGQAPLSFAQLVHWNLSGLGERHAVRQIVSATSLRGSLDRDALQRSLDELVRRHGALRTRILISGGVPIQEAVDSVRCEIEVSEPREFGDAERARQISLEIERLVLQPIDISQAPLFGVRLLRMATNEHVLLVAMEHSISDAFSMRILLRELFSAYFQVVACREMTLPPVGTQFLEHSKRQRKAHAAWFAKHSAYWRERLGKGERFRFPQDERVFEPGVGWDMVPVSFDSSSKQQLSALLRAKGVTLPIGVFAIYAAFVLCWCRASRAIFMYQSDGRVSPSVQNTIGLFATVLYLCVEIRPHDRLGDLLARVMDEYCNSQEHFDHAFMESRAPRPEFARNSGFSWIPQHSSKDGFEGGEGFEGGASGSALEISSVDFEHPMRKRLELDLEPSIGLHDRGTEIIGGVHFPLDRFARETLERFARSFSVFVREWGSHPEANVAEIARRALS